VTVEQPEPGISSTPPLWRCLAGLGRPDRGAAIGGRSHTIGAAQGRLLADAVATSAHQFQPAIEYAVDRGGLFGGWTTTCGSSGATAHRRPASSIRKSAPSPGSSAAPPPRACRIAYTDLLRQQAALDVGAPAPWTAEVVLRRLSRR